MLPTHGGGGGVIGGDGGGGGVVGGGDGGGGVGGDGAPGVPDINLLCFQVRSEPCHAMLCESF